ncbi:MAG: tetratricopeptide repeat protein, partial [Chloroflexi bacterium]|nr:tetratricopeptide repeat protein [Chloroflexota bacterium]
RARDHPLWHSAEENARIAAGIAPNLADADYILGDALARQDAQNPSALSALARAEILTQEKELLAAIISRRGEIYFAQGKFSAALEQFTRARAIAPLDARPRTGFALTMVQLEPAQRAQATALLQQVIADAPWYSAAYSALANFAEADQDFARTEQWFKTGLEKNPNEPHLLFARGQFYARQKRFQDARATFIDALKFETHADDLQSIARALADLP